MPVGRKAATTAFSRNLYAKRVTDSSFGRGFGWWGDCYSDPFAATCGASIEGENFGKTGADVNGLSGSARRCEAPLRSHD